MGSAVVASARSQTDAVRRAADVPLAYNAVDVLERNLPARRERVALLSPERTMTFGEVAAEASRAAGGLVHKLGVRPGEFVCILAPDCAEWVTCFFGTFKAGAVAVTPSTMLTPANLAFVLDDCRARVLIVHDSLLAGVAPVRTGRRYLEHVIVIGKPAGASELSYAELISGEPTTLEPVPTHRDDLCMLNYSSGTTGEPKGIPHAHKDLPLSAQLYAVDAMGYCERDRTASVAKLFFTYGSGGNLIYAWYAGASIVLTPAPSRVAVNVLESIDRFRPTILHGVPTSYASMLAVDGFPEAYDLSSLRLCLSAGEALPLAVWQAWKERTGHEIVEGIGTTENLALFLTNRPGDVRPGSCGKPVPGWEVAIVDDEGRPVPVGETGNLLVRGETAALSYLHQYERSRQVFRGEWLATGDRYYADGDGFHWYVGRADEMLKVGGIWVSPIEIERTLAGHEAVAECAVVGAPDRSGLVKPKAFVVLRPGHAASDELARALIDHCATELSAFKRPRWIEFRTELPRGDTGKLQRSRLG
ncbi:MAG: benzoate-CoA ligase family protein [Thermoleophilia bacterium]|nr:benzoate-CoA ligase family protein [Thermoleophilia bacterium]